MTPAKAWIALLLLLGISALAFRLVRRRARPAPPPAAQGTRPALLGITGRYSGESIELGETGVTLGRDPRAASLVFAHASSISKRHCTVRWDAARRVFILEDHGSTNGTFLAGGERLTPDVPRDLPPGGRFYLGDLYTQFEVRLEA